MTVTRKIGVLFGVLFITTLWPAFAHGQAYTFGWDDPLDPCAPYEGSVNNELFKAPIGDLTRHHIDYSSWYDIVADHLGRNKYDFIELLDDQTLREVLHNWNSDDDSKTALYETLRSQLTTLQEAQLINGYDAVSHCHLFKTMDVMFNVLVAESATTPERQKHLWNVWHIAWSDITITRFASQGAPSALSISEGVEGLFELVDYWSDVPDAKFEIRYDPLFGFPTQFFIFPEAGSGEYIMYKTENFTILPAPSPLQHAIDYSAYYAAASTILGIDAEILATSNKRPWDYAEELGVDVGELQFAIQATWQTDAPTAEEETLIGKQQLEYVLSLPQEEAIAVSSGTHYQWGMVSGDRDESGPTNNSVKHFARVRPLDLLTNASRQRDFWDGWLVSDYQFEYREVCECLDEDTMWHTVTVVDDQIVSVVRSDGSIVDPITKSYKHITMDDLFDLIDTEEASGERQGNVTYHRYWGTPTQITTNGFPFGNPPVSIADDEIYISVRNVKPIEADLSCNVRIHTYVYPNGKRGQVTFFVSNQSDLSLDGFDVRWQQPNTRIIRSWNTTNISDAQTLGLHSDAAFGAGYAKRVSVQVEAADQFISPTNVTLNGVSCEVSN